MRSVCSLVTLADGSTHKGISHVTTPMDITKIVKPASKPVVAKCVGLLRFASPCLAHRWTVFKWALLALSSHASIGRVGQLVEWLLNPRLPTPRMLSTMGFRHRTWCHQGGRTHLGPDAPPDGGLQGGVLQLRRAGGQGGVGLALAPGFRGRCRNGLKVVWQRIV